jgi:hypothetical protein
MILGLSLSLFTEINTAHRFLESDWASHLNQHLDKLHIYGNPASDRSPFFLLIRRLRDIVLVVRCGIQAY